MFTAHSFALPSTTQPRFLIIGVAATYGPRDEITGEIVHVEGTAETRGWARHLAQRLVTQYGLPEDSDFDVDILDLHPEREPKQHTCAEPVWPDQDLPF